MTNKSYIKGYRFEMRVKKDLERAGFYVIRQGKSRFPDLICFPPNGIGKTTVVECKCSKDSFRGDDATRLVETAHKIGALPVLAFKDKRGHIKYRTYPVLELGHMGKRVSVKL